MSVAHEPEELYSLLVPLHQARLIVPRACVAEVVGYTGPTPVADSPDWFLGVIDWNGRRLPVISFERAAGYALPEIRGRARVVIFYAVGGVLRHGYFGVLTQGFPQLVRVNPDVLQPDAETFPDDSPVVCRIRMINEYPLIPDLERLEEMISEADETAAS